MADILSTFTREQLKQMTIDYILSDGKGQIVHEKSINDMLIDALTDTNLGYYNGAYFKRVETSESVVQALVKTHSDMVSFRDTIHDHIGVSLREAFKGVNDEFYTKLVKIGDSSTDRIGFKDSRIPFIEIHTAWDITLEDDGTEVRSNDRKSYWLCFELPPEEEEEPCEYPDCYDEIFPCERMRYDCM